MKPVLLTALALTLSLTARADEGMWTFDNLPKNQLKQKHGFEADQAWLDHVRLSALQFPGGSGSFVSKDGLVITNHHVGRGWVQQVGGPGEKDYIKHGFLAKTHEEEIRVPGATLRTLMEMANITDKVAAAVKPGMDEKAAGEARSRAIETLQKEMAQKTGLDVDPVVLYQGGETWLYAYKVHRDIRLVMAPEGQIAGFGGDPDNFTYPRHDLDFTLFRVYENGKPYTPTHHLTWATEGVKYGDLTFVVGHPGRTQRQITFAQMRFQRDTGFPVGLAAAERQRADLYAYGRKSPEHMRQVWVTILNVENGIKARSGYWTGLKDVESMARVEAAEAELRAKVDADPRLKAEAGQSWARIEETLKAQKPLTQEGPFVNATYGQAVAQAMNLLGAKFRIRPSGNAELDRFMLERSLEHLKAGLPADHPVRKAVLGDREPKAVAELLMGSKLLDATFVKHLQEGGKATQDACQDPALVIARALRPLAQDFARKQEALDAVLAEHATRIAKARFAVYGKTKYPDATSSLRLTFGEVATCEGLGTLIQPFTTFHGLFDRAAAWGPEAHEGAWALPQRWIDKKGALKLETPFNFIHKVDIIGGNSGSPVLNRKGEFVGIIFDGNITMLPGNFYYDEKVNRGVTLDGRAIIEALDKVYGASHLVSELKGL